MSLNKEELKDIIRKNFIYLVEPDLQEDIASVSGMQVCKKGTVFLDFGEFIKSIPLIMSGIMKVIREDEDGNEIFLYYLNPGQTCALALTCCMIDKRSSIKAVAEEDVECLTIPVRYMDEWMTKYPSWRNYVMTTYNFRYEELLATVDDIAFKNMDERLVNFLIQKSATTEKDVIHITHSEIAKDLNASREAVSRLLKKLENDNRIELGRNKIRIISLF